MSARYAVAVNRAGVNTANTVLAEIRASSSARVFLEELGVSMAVLPSTAPRLVLARATNTPAGGTNNTPVPLDPDDGASLTSLILTGQSTAPTFTTAGPWGQVGGLPLTLGSGFLWTFPGNGLVIPRSASLLLANLLASGATLGSFDIYAKWRE
jgi:hypothetical protein